MVCHYLFDLVYNPELSSFLNEGKTKEAKLFFEKMKLDSALLISDEFDQKSILAMRNLKNFSFLEVSDLNPYDLIKAKHILLTHSSVPKIKELLNVK